MVKQWHKAKSQDKYLIHQYGKILEMLDISESDLEVLFDAGEGWSELQKCLLKKNSRIHNKISNDIKSDDFPLPVRLFLES